MISIIAKFIVNEGDELNFLAEIGGLIKASQAEKGCIEYILHKDTEKPRTYCLIEKWQDSKAVALHNNTTHFTSTVPKLLKLAKVEIDVYEPV